MSRKLLFAAVGLIAAAVLCGPAAAVTTFSTSVFVEDFDTSCGGSVGGNFDTPSTQGVTCPAARAHASSAPGHVGVGAEVLGNGIVRTAVADFLTTVTFVPTANQNPNALIPVQLNLDFTGSMQISGSANTGYSVIASIGGLDFLRSASIDTGAPPSHGVITLGFSEGGESGTQFSDAVNGVLTTPVVMAPLLTPVPIRIHLGVVGFGNSGTVEDAFLNSLDFVRSRDLFTLPDGYTAQDPEAFIVDNRFAPPDGAPEPASWTLLVAGFGLAGALVRKASLRGCVQ